MYRNLLLLYLSIYRIKKIIYELRSSQKFTKIKFWVRVPIAVGLCPAAAHFYRWTLWTIHHFLVSSSRKNTRVKTKKIRSIISDNRSFLLFVSMQLLLITGTTYKLSSVLQKLWMVIWVGFIRLKLTFSLETLYANFGKFNVFLVKTTVKFRNLKISKIHNADANSFQGFVHISEIYY